MLASNAPRRHVALVGRAGAEALAALPPDSQRWLPPLPIRPCSAEYREAWMETMRQTMRQRQEGVEGGGCPAVAAAQPDPKRLELMLEAQGLWDATMADTIVRHCREAAGAGERPLVLHVNGSFHSRGGR